MDNQGLDPAVMEAMQRRQEGQASQQAPQMAPQMAPPQAPPSMQEMPPMMAPATTGKEEFVPSNGHEFLLTTLAETLKNDYKLESEKLKFGAPQMAPPLQ